MKKYIKKAFLCTHKLLQNPLGQWTVPAEQRDRRYPAIYNACRQAIHQDNGKIYRQLRILHADRRTLQADLANPIPSIQSPGYPAIDSAAFQNNILFAHQFTNRNARATPAPPGTTHHYQFGYIPTWTADLLPYTAPSTETYPLA